jgi:hypothetical protein
MAAAAAAAADAVGGGGGGRGLSDKDLEVLEREYYENARRGIPLSVPDLRAFAKTRKIAGVTTATLESLKSLWEVTAVHAEKRARKGFAGALVPKLGCIFVDMAEYKKNLKVANRQRCFLLVGSDALSEKLSCVPLANKKQESWEAGIRYMVDHVYPVVTTIVCDRDVSVTGELFQARLKREMGIDFYHLRVRSKSWKSERGIRFLKRSISVGLGMNARGDNNWLKLVEPILTNFNSKFVKGTKIRRDAVSKDNVMELLAQKYKTREFGVYFNHSVVSVFSAKMSRGLGFKFSPGQKVLLTRASTYESGESKAKGAFEKPSVEGTFGRTVYTIDRAVLKTNEARYYVMCYYLNKLDGTKLQGLYYAHELQAASFADRTKRSWEEGPGAVRDQTVQAASVARQAASRRSKRRE